MPTYKWDTYLKSHISGIFLLKKIRLLYFIVVQILQYSKSGVFIYTISFEMWVQVVHIHILLSLIVLKNETK